MTARGPASAMLACVDRWFTAPQPDAAGREAGRLLGLIASDETGLA